MTTGSGTPPEDCARCPRLVDYRSALRIEYPGYFNRPVPAFGPADCRLLIVGLAPGKSGANRTGRPFTGDYAGDLLYATLAKFGFARGRYQADAADGLTLDGARITNAVRCVPPGNRPEPEEIRMCRAYLESEMQALDQVSAIIALGRIAHDQILAVFALRRGSFPFRHGAAHRLTERITLFDSYHCSRYNTNTGRLTTPMFEAVFATVSASLSTL